MEALKATVARPVKTSEELLQWGDFVFIPKRTPNWPEFDAIILSCPYCGNPVSTTSRHTIVSKEPLTIGEPIACPYSARNTTLIEEAITPPQGLFRRATWQLFGKKTRIVSKSAPHAFSVKDGKIMPA